ncbi:hypothetical protein ACSQ5K_14700 [Pseudomonas sp. PhalM4]
MAKVGSRSYSEQETLDLLADARSILFPADFPAVSGADWLLEGGFGSSVWKTKNGGKEYFYERWHLTWNVSFDRVLPNYSNLMDAQNAKCFETVQKWAFALRSGWLGHDIGPKHWHGSCNWALSFTSWIYLYDADFSPAQDGFSLIDKDDVKMLMGELAVGGWAHALKIIERTFKVLYRVACSSDPSPSDLSNLPNVSPEVVSCIVSALEESGRFIKREKGDHRLVSRHYLAEMVGCTAKAFDAQSVRLFLRQFEQAAGSSTILVPGKYKTAFPNARNALLESSAHNRLTKGALADHAANCALVLSGGFMPGIGLPNIVLSHRDLIRELDPEATPVKHQTLLKPSYALASLNEAALWITQYGDRLVEVYANHLVDRAIIDIDYTYLGYCKLYDIKQEAFATQIQGLKTKEEVLSTEHPLVQSLGLVTPFIAGERQPIKGALSLSQAIYILIGACAYAISIMKPVREGELAMLEHNCAFRNNKTGGCFIKVPVEKSAELGLLDEALRPIPYLIYKAITILQRLGDFTARLFFGDAARPCRLFYYPSREGFSPPIDKNIRVSIKRCMDWFCEYLDFPPDEYGRRHYPRVHELRKFHLLLLTWDDRLHGWECGGWMAVHKDPRHMQAYTEANIDGSEISEWEAEYVEDKLLAIERNSSIVTESEVTRLYERVKSDFNVEKVTSLPSDKFRSYLKSFWRQVSIKSFP